MDSKGIKTKRGTRRLIQLYSALLHNACLKGFIDGRIYQGGAKYLCAPGLNCYSCPGATAACPLGALQNALSAAGHRAGWYVLGILLLYGMILGRTICGWLCPFGLIQELLERLPTPKLKKSAVTRALSWLKYALLAVFAIAIPLFYGLRQDLPLPAFCKYICPAGTLEGAVGHLVNPANEGMFSMLGALFTQKFVILVVVALACLFCYRAFCRFLCPLGAIYSLFNRFSLVGVRVDPDRCNGCGACVRGCGMDVRRVGDRECIHCGRCMEDCGRGAISIKAGSVTLRAPATLRPGEGPGAQARQKRRGRIAWGAALALLCLALIWFNVLDPSLQSPSARAAGAGTTDASVGHEVGQQLQDFSLTCYDGSEFRLAEQRGRVVFINLWATSCTPCKRELPLFDALYREHEGDVAMLIVHASLVTDDPQAYLAKQGYAMPCATDEGDAVSGIVGGAGLYPQTVVLDRSGGVVYNRAGAMTAELLAALYDAADGSTGAPAADVPEAVEAVDSAPADGAYRVIVSDATGGPIEGATVQFCDDSVCFFQRTDALGVATFTPDAPGVYEVHVLKAPEGYAPDEALYPTPDTFSDIRIVLEPAP